MKLFCRILGEGPPLIIMHGLYGSSDNWVTIARELSEAYSVYIPDQRNHGRSPHNSRHDYSGMTSDLEELVEEHNISETVLLGHSMGGKVAINYAIAHPEKITSLIVADISPFKRYPEDLRIINSHEKILKTLLYTTVTELSSRKEAEEIMVKAIDDKKTAAFLLKNLIRNSAGKFEWRINTPALYNNIEKLMSGLSIPEDYYNGITGFPVLFIKGGNSDYLPDSHRPQISRLFPTAEFATIQGAGHWLHAEKPVEFIRIVREFLAGTY